MTIQAYRFAASAYDLLVKAVVGLLDAAETRLLGARETVT